MTNLFLPRRAFAVVALGSCIFLATATIPLEAASKAKSGKRSESKAKHNCEEVYRKNPILNCGSGACLMDNAKSRETRMAAGCNDLSH